IGDDIGRTPKLVRHNSFPGRWVDPENYLGGIQRAADVRDLHLLFLEIVCETAGAGAFVARDVKVFAGERAIRTTNSRVSTVHPRSAKPAGPQNSGAVAPPTGGIAIRATDCHPDCGRTLPLPLPQKVICLDRNHRANGVWRYCALNVEPKIVRGIEEIRS